MYKITKGNTRSATNNLAMRKLRNAINHTAGLGTLSMLWCVCAVLRSAALRSSEARRATIVLSCRCYAVCVVCRCVVCVVVLFAVALHLAMRCSAVCKGFNVLRCV